MKRLHLTLATISAAAILAACGGGSSSPHATPLTVSGVAATGAALSNASITVQCSGGTATFSADASGAFMQTIPDAKLPCVLTASGNDKNGKPVTLHSLIPGTGPALGPVRANITPLTELLMAKLTGKDPASLLLDGFVSSDAAAQTDTINTLETIFQNMIASLSPSLDLSSITSILKDVFSAGSGLGYDGVLDQLGKLLDAAGITLADLTSAVASTQSTSTLTTLSTLRTTLAPGAPGCSALKAGNYHVANFGTSGPITALSISADFSMVTVDGVPHAATASMNPCEFLMDNASMIHTARSGISVMDDGAAMVNVLIPDQQIALSDLAGTFDRIQFGNAFDPGSGDFGDVTFDATGQNTASTHCPTGVGSCAADPNGPLGQLGHLVATSDHGFDHVSPTGTSEAHVFAFRNAQGRTILIGKMANGSAVVLAQKLKLPLPLTGQQNTNFFWQYKMTTNGTTTFVTPSTTDSNYATAVDTATEAVTRFFPPSGMGDTVYWNYSGADAAIDGLRYRDPTLCTLNGAPSTCQGTMQLPYDGVTFAVNSDGAAHTRGLSISVQRP